MKYLLLALRFIFGFLSIVLFLGFVRAVFLYISTGTDVGTVTTGLLWQLAIYMCVCIFLTGLFNNIYDRMGFYDDRLIRKEDLPRNVKVIRKEEIKPEREVY